MTPYARELAGWLATLEGREAFNNRPASEVLALRAGSLRRDLASLEAKGIATGPGVEAAQDLLRLFEKAKAPPEAG